jgi:hypothetical protein
VGTKYTFKQEFTPEFNPYNSANASTISMELHGDLNLTQILERFEEFLRGSGFYFDGHLDFVHDDTESHDDFAEDNMNMTLSFPDGTEETVNIAPHSDYYYDTNRNK